MTVHYHTHTTTQPLSHTHTHKLHMLCYETSNTLLAQEKHPFKPLSANSQEKVCIACECLYVSTEDVFLWSSSSCEDQLKEMSKKIHYTCIVLSI